jgi:hypothetical protein
MIDTVGLSDQLTLGLVLESSHRLVIAAVVELHLVPQAVARIEMSVLSSGLSSVLASIIAVGVMMDGRGLAGMLLCSTPELISNLVIVTSTVADQLKLCILSEWVMSRLRGLKLTPLRRATPQELQHHNKRHRRLLHMVSTLSVWP